MIRSRVCLLSVVTALLVAGPAMAYSWPLLFGLPAVFGQEGPRAEKPLPPPPSFEESESRDLPAQIKVTKGAIVEVPPSECKSAAMPYADECLHCPVWSQDCCDPAGKFVGIWQKLWRQGKFREAFVVARCAVQADPDNVDARHALVVSQIVNETSPPNAFRSLTEQQCPDLHFSAQYAPVSGGALRLNGDQPWNGLLPAGTLTPDLNIPLKTASCDVDACCPMIDCPLVALFEQVFGGCREAKASGCGPCPIATGHCPQAGDSTHCPRTIAINRMIARQLETPCSFHWTNAPLRQIISDLQSTTGISIVPDVRALRASNVSLDMPMSLSIDHVKLRSALNILLGQAKLAYVIRDQALQITTEESANRCATAAEGLGGDCGMQIVRGPQGTKMIWIIREPATMQAFPPAPTVSRPAPLPPPHFAPPPPIMASPEGMVIPVPVPQPPLVDHADYTVSGPQYIVPPHPGRPTLYDPAAEWCEVAPRPLPVTPKHVQITQSGRHVQLSSPNYSAQCDRIRGGANGELILEGNVRLISRRHGQSMTINAQRVLLNVKHDQFVVEQADGMEQSRVNIAPVSGAATEHSLLNEPRDREQIFNFRVGLLR